MSSSFNLEQVRKAYSDPAVSKIVELTKRIAKIEAENIEIESDDLTGYGDSDRTKILYNDFWNHHQRFSTNYDYVEFDGIDDYVDLGNHSFLWSQPLGKFSFSCWIFPTLIDGTARVILEHGGGTAHGFRSYITNDDLVLNLYDSGAVLKQAFTSGDKLRANNWNFVTGVYDNSLGSANVKCFVNAEVGSTTANLTENLNKSAILTLSNSTTDFQGRMRDFRWWSTKALTQTEMERVMNNDILAPVPDYWQPLQDPGTGTNPVDTIQGLTGFLTSGAVFPARDSPLTCFEPDYDHFALDLRFDTIINQLHDYSGKKHYAYIFGEPCPTTGTKVWYKKLNPVWKFSQDDKVYCTIPDQDDPPDTLDFRMIGETVGHSWIFRLNFASLDIYDSWNQTLLEHYDDSSNRYCIRVSETGQIHYIVSRAGTDYKIRTTNNVVSPNQDIEIALTYNVSGNVIKIYLNGVPQATTTTGQAFETFNFNDTYIFCKVPSTTQEPVDGFCDFNHVDLLRFYQSKVLTDAEVLNHYNNQFTISNIPEGKVGITDASVVAGQFVGLPSFTTTSFTDTSFTT